MGNYTAKQVTEILQIDDPNMNLRTVRYYTQIGLVPPLELVGNKRVYTDYHLHYFRAIITLSKTGYTLASSQEKLNSLSLENIIKIGEQIVLYRPQHVLNNEIYKLNENIILTINSHISAEQKNKVIDSFFQILRGEDN